jgi:hypothetical protein
MMESFGATVSMAIIGAGLLGLALSASVGAGLLVWWVVSACFCRLCGGGEGEQNDVHLGDRFVVGVVGRAGHGKDSIGKFMAGRYGFLVDHFAKTLKDLARVLFLFSERQLYGDQKEQIDPSWGVSPRAVLQFFGTEVVRDMFPKLMPHIGSRFWLEHLRRRQTALLRKHEAEPTSQTSNLVVCDVRFPNEVELIKELGGVIVKVVRPGFDAFADPNKKSSANEDQPKTHNQPETHNVADSEHITSEDAPPAKPAPKKRRIAWQSPEAAAHTLAVLNGKDVTPAHKNVTEPTSSDELSPGLSTQSIKASSEQPGSSLSSTSNSTNANIGAGSDSSSRIDVGAMDGSSAEPMPTAVSCCPGNDAPSSTAPGCGFPTAALTDRMPPNSSEGTDCGASSTQPSGSASASASVTVAAPRTPALDLSAARVLSAGSCAKGGGIAMGAGHQSEIHADELPADLIILNDGTLEDLQRKVENELIPFLKSARITRASAALAKRRRSRKAD